LLQLKKAKEGQDEVWHKNNNRRKRANRRKNNQCQTSNELFEKGQRWAQTTWNTLRFGNHIGSIHISEAMWVKQSIWNSGLGTVSI
jgi:hypothetical protein